MTVRRKARAGRIRRLLARAERATPTGHLRSSGQREQVVEAVLEVGKHFTVEELHAHLHGGPARVAFSTVYRTVRLLVETGILAERHFAGGIARFELVGDEGEHHDHLICVRCGLVVEFEEPHIEELQERVAERHGYALRAHTHELYGLCKGCTARTEP